MNETALLDRIRDAGHEACVIATYNVYFPFFEGVVLPRLQAAGCRHVVLLADADQLARALEDPAARPTVAGRKYTLIPVTASGAFHPKIVLLVGKKKATLHIGSHNLTYAGWTHNTELTTEYAATASDSPAGSTLRAAWRFLRDWTDLAPAVLRSALDGVEELLPWIAGDDLAGAELFGSRRSGPSLWSQVRAQLPTRARRVLVTGPFFDAGCNFVRTLQRDLAVDELVVAVDPTSVSMDAVAMRLLKSTKLVAVPEQDGDRHPYLHAKSLLIETADGQEVLVVGSANPSAAAWLVGGTTGESGVWRNAEAVVVRSGPVGALSEPLGLDKWWTGPELTPSELLQIRPVGMEPSAGQSSGAVLVAIATDDGFELPEDPRLGPTVAVQLQDTRGACHSRALVPTSAGWIVKEIDEQARFRTSWLRIADGETAWLVPVHHTALVAALSPSNQDPRIQRAMAALDLETPDLEGFLDLVTRVLFDADKAGSSGVSGGGGITASLPSVADYTVLGIDADQAAMMHAQRRRTAVTLTALIDALLLRLAEPRAEGTSILAGRMAKSEEEQIGSEDEDEDIEYEQQSVVAACQRRSKLLVERLVKQLDANSIGADAILLRATAVLAALRHLRQAERKLSWLPRGESLVLPETRQKMLGALSQRMFQRNDGILARATGARPKDLATLKGLSVGLAFDAGLDVRSLRSEKALTDARRSALAQIAQLLLILPPLASDHSAVQIARDLLGSRAGESTWLDAQISWINRVEAAVRNPATAQRSLRSIVPGDIAVSRLKAGQPLMVVLERIGGNVHMHDGCAPRKFLEAAVIVVHAAHPN